MVSPIKKEILPIKLLTAALAAVWYLRENESILNACEKYSLNWEAKE